MFWVLWGGFWVVGGWWLGDSGVWFGWLGLLLVLWLVFGWVVCVLNIVRICVDGA